MTMPRVMRLLALIALLVVASGVSLWLKRRPAAGPSASRPSILETRFDEPAFQPDAPATALHELAERTADELVAHYPGDPHALNVQARRHFQVDQQDQAVAIWRQCLEVDPTFADAYFGLGLIAIDRQEYDEAVEHFEDVDRLDTKDPRVPVLLAKALMHAGRAEDAILVLEHHVRTERSTADAWEMLGRAHMQRQQFEQAIECFGVAVAAVPKMKDAVYGLWRCHIALGNTEEAEAYGKQFRALDEKAFVRKLESAQGFQDRARAASVAGQTLADAARVHSHHGDWQRAEDALLRAVSLQPNDFQFLNQLQRSLQQRGAFAEAAEVGTRMVELDSQALDQWLNLAWLYSHLDQPDQALAACHKAIAINPDDPRCRKAYEIVQRAN